MVSKLAVVFGLLLILLSACSSNTFTFTGESDSWSAQLKVTQHSNDYEDQVFQLRYIGKDFGSDGDVTFYVDTNAGGFGGSGFNTLNEFGVLETSKQTNPTNAKIQENSEVEVTVKWNDDTETITLRNN